MSWCRSGRKHRSIIVPKGILDPNQNNVLELPTNLDLNTTFVVKTVGSPHGYLVVEPVTDGSTLLTETQNSSPSPENPQNSGPTYADFGVQVQYQPQIPSQIQTQPPVSPPITQMPPQMQPQVSSYYQPPQFPSPQPMQPPSNAFNNLCSGLAMRENQNPHSPLCPVCAALFSRPQTNSSFLRQPYSHLGKSNYNPSTYCPNLAYISASNCNPNYDPIKSRQHLPFSFRSETSIPLQQPSQPDISKLIEEKIEKTLKPLLMCLSNSFPEKDYCNPLRDSCSNDSQQRTCRKPNCPRHKSSNEDLNDDHRGCRSNRGRTISFVPSRSSEFEIPNQRPSASCPRSGARSVRAAAATTMTYDDFECGLSDSSVIRNSSPTGLLNDSQGIRRGVSFHPQRDRNLSVGSTSDDLNTARIFNASEDLDATRILSDPDNSVLTQRGEHFLNSTFGGSDSSLGNRRVRRRR